MRVKGGSKLRCWHQARSVAPARSSLAPGAPARQLHAAYPLAYHLTVNATLYLGREAESLYR